MARLFKRERWSIFKQRHNVEKEERFRRRVEDHLTDSKLEEIDGAIYRDGQLWIEADGTHKPWFRAWFECFGE